MCLGLTAEKSCMKMMEDNLFLFYFYDIIISKDKIMSRSSVDVAPRRYGLFQALQAFQYRSSDENGEICCGARRRSCHRLI